MNLQATARRHRQSCNTARNHPAPPQRRAATPPHPRRNRHGSHFTSASACGPPRSRRLAGFYRLVFQKAQVQAGRTVRRARRAPRRVYRRMHVSGDSGDGDGEPAPSLAFFEAAPESIASAHAERRRVRALLAAWERHFAAEAEAPPPLPHLSGRRR